jgi:hypothetical protein
MVGRLWGSVPHPNDLRRIPDARDAARDVDPRQYVGAHPWHTSASKVLDNALVGLMRAIGDGVLS